MESNSEIVSRDATYQPAFWNAEELIDDDKMDTFLRYEIATAEKQSNQIELQ